MSGRNSTYRLVQISATGSVYAYAPGRGAIHGLRLEGYRGIMHCDGYEAYKTMTRETRADALSGTLAFCWSHLWRQFVKIEREASPASAPVAREALERIAQLYAIEKGHHGRSDAERGRQAHAKPVATALKQWFEAQLDHLANVLAKLVNGWPAARLDELLRWASTYTMHAHDPRLAA